MPHLAENSGNFMVAWSVLRSWMTMIGLIDIGLGNQRSVANALDAVGAVYQTIGNPKNLQSCTAFILPGVGSFADASHRIKEKGWLNALKAEVLEKQKPYLGICLGMQLLATTGYENGVTTGFNWIPGEVRPIEPKHPDLSIPHMGWNDVQFHDQENGISKGIGSNSCFYFMHSFHFCTRSEDHVKGFTEYGDRVTACVQNGHIWGTQFHPEKSQQAGLAVIRNFKQLNAIHHEC